MNLAHKIRLNPTSEQVNYFVRAAGVHRFTYNWALEEWVRQYENGEKPSAYKLKKEFNAIKKVEYPFVTEVHRDCSSQPFIDLGKAFSNFFRRIKNGEEKAGYPKFKSKRRSKQSFYIANDKFILEGNYIRIPRLGWVNMAEELRFDCKVLSARVSKDGGRWYVSIAVDVSIDDQYRNGLEPVGVDLGIKELMVLSNGVVAENQRTTLTHQKRLRMLNKKLSRQQRGSNNWWKTVEKLRKLHTKMKNQRQDYIHKWTSYLTSNYGLIGIENLNVNGMLKNRKLAKHVADASFGKIVGQLEYKQYIYGSAVWKVDRWFPSSKTCSECGWVDKNLTLDNREFLCNSCGVVIDRDLNAAINIKNEALRLAYNEPSPVVASSA